MYKPLLFTFLILCAELSLMQSSLVSNSVGDTHTGQNAITGTAQSEPNVFLYVPIAREYVGRPLFDLPTWKFALICSFVTMIVITILFAYVAEGGMSGELGTMVKILGWGTPLLTVIFRFLLL